jgi:hypothetical protein
MACGALPTVDRQIMLFDSWTPQRLRERQGPGISRLTHRQGVQFVVGGAAKAEIDSPSPNSLRTNAPLE